MDERKKIAVSALWVSLGTLVTRIFGLLREVAMAALFGTGVAADAFSVAFRFPNLLRNLVGEGALSAAFLPKFSEVESREGPEAAFRMASAVFTALFAALIVICSLGILFAPQLISIIVIGWRDDPARKLLAIKLVRILFTYAGFMGLAAYCHAILNAHRRFFVSSVAPAFMNIAWLLGTGVAGLFLSSETGRIETVAVFVVAGSALQFLWQFIWMKRTGWNFSWSLKSRWHDLIEVGTLLLPSLLALASFQLNYFADVLLASLLPGGSVSSLTYANRLLYLPLGLLGYAIATATLPSLSVSAALEERGDLAKLLSYTVRSIFTLLLPIALVTITLRTEIVSLLFERGSFDAARSTPMVSWALMFYMIGLPFLGLARGLTQGFYALKNTLTPVLITVTGVVVNIELSIIFMYYLDHGGLALGTSLTAIFTVTLLMYHLKLLLPEFNLRPVLSNIARVTGAGAVSALGAWLFARYISREMITAVPFLTKLAHLALPTIVFFAIFLLFSKIFAIREVREVSSRAMKRLFARKS
ncbi:MAG TPA: murein biosynthesis integral membrane protein MurJ [candidate division Zixibacteria bacterium]|nr:murein biosynthesis integral membrane protein MurJ [candidate division Zixibacteria bacterium]